MFEMSPFEFWYTIDSLLHCGILIMLSIAVILVLGVWITALWEMLLDACRGLYYKLPKFNDKPIGDEKDKATKID